MGLFAFSKKKKGELTEAQLKWNKMWQLWAEGHADSPYAELMTYQSEINNGGHEQYFINEESTSDIEKEMSSLETILPSKLREALEEAYRAYMSMDEEEDEEAEEILEQCDDLFYEHQDEINRILEKYAAGIKL